MKIGFLITARLKSSRLKLKLMMKLGGKTVIEQVITRAKAVIECDNVVLCTSTKNQDLPLVRTAKENDIYYYNGSPDDVLQRLLEAAELYGFDYILGTTADNPLFSIYHANLISDIIRSERDIDFIYTSGMPIGVNIYAIKTQALKTVCEFKEELDTEIWGYLVNRPEIFNVRELKVESEFVLEGVDRISLDYMEDYRFIATIYKNFPEGVIDVLDAYDFIKLNNELQELTRHIRQADLTDQVKLRIDKFFIENREKILSIKNRIYKCETR